MTNLPISASTAQTAAPGKQSANAADNGDAAAQPFGEVLARQISAPDLKVAKRDDKLAVELAAQTTVDASDIDVKADDKVSPDTAAALPGDMLAALLPQVMNTAATAATSGDKTDAAATALPGRPGIANTKKEPAIQADIKDKTAPVATADPKIKAQPFAAALGESASRTATGMQAVAVAREANVAAAAVSAAAQQPSAAALSTMQNVAANIAAPITQVLPLTVNTPVSQPKWGDEFSQKITWLASSRMDQSAELHLNPPQLGPLDVVLKVSGDQATALFTSPHAAVREAIEQALPRLRDMLADSGITLGNATVNDQAARDQSGTEARRGSGNGSNELPAGTVSSNNVSQVSPIARHNGIVDTFA